MWIEQVLFKLEEAPILYKTKRGIPFIQTFH